MIDFLYLIGKFKKAGLLPTLLVLGGWLYGIILLLVVLYYLVKIIIKKFKNKY